MTPTSITSQLGSEEEAIVCAGEIGKAWQMTPGALDWLRGQAQRTAKGDGTAGPQALGSGIAVRFGRTDQIQNAADFFRDVLP